MQELKPVIVKGVALAGIFFVGSAAATDAGTTAIASCAKLTDDKARLACFDREAAALNGGQTPVSANAAGSAAPAAPPVSSAAPQAAQPVAAPAPTSAPAKLTAEQAMGLGPGRIQQLESPQESAEQAKFKELTVKIQSVRTSATGREVFTLENGQVWQQTELDPNFSVQPGDPVKITHGALGSYWMSAGIHSNTHVTRLH